MNSYTLRIAKKSLQIIRRLPGAAVETQSLVGTARWPTEFADGRSVTGDGAANVIEGGAGNDTINGAGGTDTNSYANAASAVTFNLATTTAQNTGGAGTDTVTNMENILGSAYNDTLTGNSGNNVIEPEQIRSTAKAGRISSPLKSPAPSAIRTRLRISASRTSTCWISRRCWSAGTRRRAPSMTS